MKKYLFFMFFVFFAAAAFGYCSMPVTLANGSIPCASGLSTDPSKVHAYLWIQGKADWTTDNTGTWATAPGTCTGGCDSDGMDVMDEGCWNMTSILISGEDCAVGNPGEYYLLTDWSTSPTGIGYDGCPSADSSERAILLIYDDDGKYVLQSRSQGKVWENWDEIGTTEAANLYLFFDTIESTGVAGANQVDIYFDPIPDSVKNGVYSSGDVPATPLVTGFRLYYYEGPSYPTNLSTSAWIAGDSFSSSTTTALNYTFPTGMDCLFVSRALIVDGKELPVVSASYRHVVSMPSTGTPIDIDPCECSGVFVWNESDCLDSEGFWHVDALVDGTTIYENACGEPWFFAPECNVTHTMQFRKRSIIGDLISCWSEPSTFMDQNSAPTQPAITSILDNDPAANTGITITYTPGTPAMRHDLYKDGLLLQYNFVSGTTINDLNCNGAHAFTVAAVGTGPCSNTTISSAVSGTDYCSAFPNELAPGATPSDALLFSNDKTTANWPSYTGATGYRLYRGTQADLANLPGGTVDNSCLRYDGTVTSVDLSGDTPASESFLWYLVTAYNGAGEGPAGTGRIINSSGGCP